MKIQIGMTVAAVSQGGPGPERPGFIRCEVPRDKIDDETGAGAAELVARIEVGALEGVTIGQTVTVTLES